MANEDKGTKAPKPAPPKPEPLKPITIIKGGWSPGKPK